MSMREVDHAEMSDLPAVWLLECFGLLAPSSEFKWKWSFRV